MRNLATQPSQRQQITLCAGERALMRWYPTAPLSRIHALRNQRARYPLIQGGKRDDARQPPFTFGHGAGGAA